MRQNLKTVSALRGLALKLEKKETIKVEEES